MLHHHPDYWTNPEVFDPDRFSPERVAERNKYIFLPFGEGPRKCIGAPLAMAEAHLILATIAQRYHLRPAPYQAVVPSPEFTLKIKNGLLMLPEGR
jgi:cytochrome P450